MISKEYAEHYQWGDRCDGWYLVNRQDMLIIHEKMPPGTREKRHYHAASRQFFFVLSGVLTMELDGTVQDISAQQGIEIPPQSAHQAQNNGDGAVEFLVISHPTTRGDREDIA